jgi:hypothetical protein
MPPKKRPTTHDVSRLKVLAAGDEAAFAAHVTELLESGDRIAREAALESLAERPLASLRPVLRELYAELASDGAKHDPAARLRSHIVRVLLALADVRDADIAIRAADTYEQATGVDATTPLRSLGLKLVAATAPDLLPYIAAEHVNDQSAFSPEPANTALQLLAATGHQAAVYQWLFTSDQHEAALVAAAFELLAETPALVVARAIGHIMAGALARQDEWLLTTLAEAIVAREMDALYPEFEALLQSKISDELYSYVALLLASTNRPPLLAILDAQMADVRRRAAIVMALRVRTTPEQAAILRRWDDGAEPS